MSSKLFSKYTRNLILMFDLFAVLAGAAMLFCGDANVVEAQTSRKVITKAKMLELAHVSRKLRMGSSQLISMVKRNGVSFRLTPAIESELRTAKLRPEVINSIRENYRGAPAETTVAGRPTGRTGDGSNGMLSNTNSYSRNTTPANNTGEDSDEDDYEKLTNGVLEAIYNQVTPGMNQEDFSRLMMSAQYMGNEALKLDASRPEAYQLLAAVAFLTKNYADAEKYSQETIDRGGTVQFDIVYIYKDKPPVKEVLYISAESVSTESEDEYEKIDTAQITSVETKRMKVRQVDVTAVVINYTEEGDDKNTYEAVFVPSFRFSKQDAELIKRIIVKQSWVE